MTPTSLVRESLAYYWRTNLAVVLGVATAVAVLGGALLVGDSVRGSLRDLVLRQLGRTDQIIVSSGLFREALGDDLRADQGFARSFADVCPLIVMQGGVTDQSGGRRVLHVPVYGVDERFWRFHGVGGPSGSRSDGRDAMLSEALAAEIGATTGSSVLIRVERPTSVPIESLHGRKDDLGRSFRLSVRAILGPDDLGEFSLRPQQGRVRAAFVPLKRLQQELDVEGRVNTLLVAEQSSASDAGRLEELVRRNATLDDIGLTVRVVGAEASSTATGAAALAVENVGGLLDSTVSTAVERAAAPMKAQPVFTYLANSLRSGGREIPYSLVTAMDLSRLPAAAALASSLAARNGRGFQAQRADASGGGANPAGSPPIVLNDWAARDLGVKPGDPLTMDYYVWEEPGRLLTRTASFEVAGIVPIVGTAADRDLAPAYPGITESESLADWDPPFPIDLRRVRQVDEDYWKRYRTTPKGFVPFEVGQELWRSRYGDRTSIRVLSESGRSRTQDRDQYAARLRASLDPLAAGLSVQDVRGEGLAASRGATDFGEYFTYFSFFLVLSALLLAALFFRLGIEQRAREVGLLRSVGYTTGRIQWIFTFEALVLAAIGGIVGVAGAVGYAALMMTGLGSWWSGAVGTDALRLHVSPSSLAAGALGAVAAAMACVWWTLRGLAKLSERSLLAGTLTVNQPAGLRGRGRLLRPLVGAMVFGSLGAALMVATSAGVLGRTGAFFGAGGAFLIACLCLIAFNLRRPIRRPLEGGGWWSVSRLGLRNAADRPGRSVLAIAVIAAATFILISVDSFRRAGVVPTDRQSGVGGYSLLVELLVPLAHDPNGRDGRELIGLDAAAGDDVTIAPFRLLPGDDASCLNLYEPRNPRILGASRTFIDSGRFAFQSSLASSDTEKANPWLLLNRAFAGDGDPVIPVIADANSMTYVLHKKLGDDITIDRGGQTLRLRLVAALADSIFQSELVMSDANFVKFFSGQEGYRLLLVETPPDGAARVASAIEEGGRDLGADAVSTTERLAEFHRVENTYISTFQTLGGLGLLVGTVGLAAVLLRNVLERRRELALLGAVGYRAAHVFAIVLAENVLLLGWGLVIGTACALIAVAPALHDRGGWPPVATEGWILLVAVFTCGLLSSIVATRAALRAPLLGALRSE